MTRMVRISTSLWLACAAGMACAAPAAGVSVGDCEVLASGQLRSNEYIASYQGGCKAGKADGQGKAEWRLRYAPNAVVRGTGRDGWRGGLLQGAIAHWDDRARIAAVRVKGRSNEEDTQGARLLQLIGSRVCGEPDCDDFLLMPSGRRLQEEAL